MPKRHQQLRKWLKQHKTKAKVLAAQVAISEAHMSNVLRGKRGVPMPLAMKFSMATGLPVENLLTDQESVEILEEFGNRSTVETADAKQ